MPVQAYLASQRPSLPTAAPEPTENGVRLFVQCMEIKKSETRKTSESECRELALKSLKARSNTY
ncbi:MAG: hypothetical protein HYR96_00705 [Deltaproteobacteria bacterium]|nr:hypothetical protein [Deltaproteobacteria bacterium]MBI3294631.1 hypothetical protein [Deltaproteobacteria bacterium]